MSGQPSIETERLILRPFTLSDAPDVQQLAGDWDIARMTTEIPHPYEDGVAKQWILTHRDDFENDRAAIFAVTLKPDCSFIGAVGLSLESDHSRAELGYWIGKPFWDHGYATEAAEAVIRYGFRQLGLNRIYARCLTYNKASARVLKKLGMTHEGRLRKHILHWGEFEDIEVYGILKAEFSAKRK